MEACRPQRTPSRDLTFGRGAVLSAFESTCDSRGDEGIGSAKRNCCKRTGGVLRICGPGVAQLGGSAYQRAVLAKAVSVRQQRGTLGAALDRELELLHRRADCGDRVCAPPGTRVHGAKTAAQRRGPAGF